MRIPLPSPKIRYSTILILCIVSTVALIKSASSSAQKDLSTADVAMQQTSPSPSEVLDWFHPANLDSAWLENGQEITSGKAAPLAPLASYVVNSNGETNATNLVTGTDASGNITLRSAIQAANTQAGSHIITFSGAVASPINPTLGQITVGNAAAGNNITITGPGMNLLTVNQTTENRIFSTGTGAVTFL